jgi:hypothetical protein
LTKSSKTGLRIRFKIDGISVLNQTKFRNDPNWKEAVRKIKDTWGSEVICETKKELALLVPGFDPELD